MKTALRHLLPTVAACTLALAPVGAAPARVVEQGLVVELHADGLGSGAPLEAGAPAHFRFRIHDESAAAPLTGLDPAAWLAPREAGEPSSPELCRRKLRTLLGGSLFSRPALDLNTYQVLVLADEPRLLALEPDFGYGQPRMLADLELPAAAFDWALDSAHRYAFLSLPGAGAVARVDTHAWKLEIASGLGSSPAGPAGWRQPERVALQPDGHYLWVAVEGGVQTFTTEPFAPVAFLATHAEAGSPPTSLEFSADGGLLYVAHPGASQLAVIDTAQRRLRSRLELPGKPASMAFSALARRLYVTLAAEDREAPGRMLILDEKPAVVGGFELAPGPGLLRFAGEGRHGIVLHPEERRVSIVDSARNRVVQTASLAGIPDQLAFTSELAYLRLRDRTELLMLPLAVLGREGEKIPTFDTVGGDRGFLDGFRPIPAAGIAPPPGTDGVLIANPGDHAVYFYKEGLAAPMGQLLLGKWSPRAVLALDRSLRELATKGTYETTLPLPAAGDYDVAFFLSSPRILHCFPVRIEAAATAPDAPSP